MEGENQTNLSEFIFVGFSDLPELQVPLFCGFLLIYLATFAGNLLTVAVIFSDSYLHTPMYFFLANLSFLDLIYTSITLPKLLANFFLEHPHISRTGCLVQFYFVLCMLCTEFILLTIMAYDRYVAICNPLRYTVIMSKKVCIRISAALWVFGLMEPIPYTVLFSQLSFCKSNRINHFFCDITALLDLSCTSTRIIENVTYFLGALVMTTFILILISYVNIISAILRIQSTEGREKAFSTCASHITMVILYYSTILIIYMRPASTYSMDQNKIFSLMYTALTPMLNPVIYSLKNRDFKRALTKARC
ncbi:olfactory receptor 5V1-like [Ambystoma mexicanum]|uniref:olfactory receptor 5V1-like n=1 Tax=Ambystoma mexicanum TaxID=8296 RepID=UPI0037E76EF0